VTVPIAVQTYTSKNNYGARTTHKVLIP
jgi:hypothetical protein